MDDREATVRLVEAILANKELVMKGGESIGAANIGDTVGVLYDKVYKAVQESG